MEFLRSLGDGARHLFQEVFDPFELLYLSIAIATLDHTVWAGAFLFEGAMTTDDAGVWRLKGLLIAIAVDLGMLLTSRFLQNSTNWQQTIVLTLSFVIAAISSFYFQMVYIMFHTPVFEISKGVDQYWVDALLPLLQARVFLLPLALPVLATVYTVARIFKKRANRQVTKIVSVKAQHVGNGLMSDLSRLIEGAERAPANLMPGQGVVSLTDATMDLHKLTWFSKQTGKAYGPYKNKLAMIQAMKRVRDILEKRQEPALPPEGDKPALPSGQ